MSLAPYFQRNAIAAAQVLRGMDAEMIGDRLSSTSVGLSLGDEAFTTPEGIALTDLLVRLFARLYPRLVIASPVEVDGLEGLARQINPDIEIAFGGKATIAVSIGSDSIALADPQISAGSRGWDGSVSTSTSLAVGSSPNPVGPGIAACLAAAGVFRFVFLAGSVDQLDEDLTISGHDLTSRPTEGDPALPDHLDTTLVGLGAIGNAAAWTLSRVPSAGLVRLVDPEFLDLGNLQRYVLGTMADVDRSKVEFAAKAFGAALVADPHQESWQSFASREPSPTRSVLVALDSATDRRAVQAALPQWIANAWTQVGDLGVSVHPWADGGACLACLYLPTGPAPNEDQLITAALGLQAEREADVRRLLHLNAAPPPSLLEEVANACDVPLEALEPYAGRPIRELYVEGICGGAVVPLSRLEGANADVHVPLAHQSAMAGVLLASRVLVGREDRAGTRVARFDVMRPLPVGVDFRQAMAKDSRGICICQDASYEGAYAAKFATF